ncbi:MAG: hypothetical protein IKL90_06005 [Alphaproteobacteria bacterium]|nr:hypothetical protein [Alphaproteobacteria bacterium]
MKKILMGIVTFFSVSAFASNFYVQSDILVSGEGKSVLEAQTNAVSEGQKKAFLMLLKKIAPTVDITQFETVDVAPLVQDVSLSDEKVSATTYKGNLSVRFKSEPIYELLEGQNEPFLTSLPEPMLLVPIFEEEGKILVFNKENPILNYFYSEKPQNDFFHVKVVSDEGQKLQEAEKIWQEGLFDKHNAFLNEYEVTKALVLKIKKSMDVYQVETFVLPKESVSTAGVNFQVMDDREDVHFVVKDLISDAFSNMEKKWVYLMTKNVAPVSIYHLLTPVSKVSELKKIKDKIAQLNFVEKVEIKGFKNKMLSVEIAFKGSIDELQRKLVLNQMSLMPYMAETDEKLYLLTFIEEKLNQTEAQSKLLNQETVAENENQAIENSF